MHDPETEPEEKHRIDFEDDNDNNFRFGDIDWPDEVVSLTSMRSLRALKIALLIFLFLLNSISKSSSLLTNMAIPHLLKKPPKIRLTKLHLSLLNFPMLGWKLLQLLTVKSCYSIRLI